tara:strand:- start:770 stop:1024 length:255 start_codon:yes stop_codon:yes gene_type:complete
MLRVLAQKTKQSQGGGNLLNKTIISLLATATLSGCQTTELADPNYIWFRSNAQLAHFNVKDATNIPASSVSKTTLTAQTLKNGR